MKYNKIGFIAIIFCVMSLCACGNKEKITSNNTGDCQPQNSSEGLRDYNTQISTESQSDFQTQSSTENLNDGGIKYLDEELAVIHNNVEYNMKFKVPVYLIKMASNRFSAPKDCFFYIHEIYINEPVSTFGKVIDVESKESMEDVKKLLCTVLGSDPYPGVMFAKPIDTIYGNKAFEIFTAADGLYRVLCCIPIPDTDCLACIVISSTDLHIMGSAIEFSQIDKITSSVIIERTK
ncbi:MAG: hypothetical protein VB118_06210 [Oscillospiraceae bacterium]|nr:hypothetical protein [Oscillospiraceae bacterium]